MTFENSTARLDEGKPQLEIAIKTVNLWTAIPSVSIGNAILESDRSSIMNVQVSFYPTLFQKFMQSLAPTTKNYLTNVQQFHCNQVFDLDNLLLYELTHNKNHSII